MSTPKEYIMETNQCRFHIPISESESGNGLTATFHGIYPKLASSEGDTPMFKEVGPVTVEGHDIDALLKNCRDEIKKIDGDIISEHEWPRT